MKVVAYVPMKLNNERLPGKNTKLLGGAVPLYHLVLDALLASKRVDEVYVFCSDPELPDLPPGVHYIRRSTSLDTSDTKINDVMRAFAQQIDADVYLLAHATAPFLSTVSIDKVVDAVASGLHDSALTVTPLREFLWRDGAPLNYDPAKIPRTQDLDELYMETSGAYAYIRALVPEGRRVGATPAPIEVSKLEAVDINDADDWAIADALFRSGAI